MSSPSLLCKNIIPALIYFSIRKRREEKITECEEMTMKEDKYMWKKEKLSTIFE
jgi:hypothetical protein